MYWGKRVRRTATTRRVLATLVLTVAMAGCTTTTTTSNPATDAVEDIPVDLMHDRFAAKIAVDAIEKKLHVETAMAQSIDVYDTYLIIEVQDPTNPEHIDSYTWRDGEIDPPSPVHLSGPQEDVYAGLFPTTAVNLGQLSHIVKTAERRCERATPIRIEQAKASYLSIERSTSFDDDGRITMRISIEGPRRSGSVEASASGDILEVSVS